MKPWIAVLMVLLGSLPVLRAAEDWRPLWDGKTLDGCHQIGEGKWTIVNGAIHGTRLASDQGGGFLVTDRVYTDFSNAPINAGYRHAVATIIAVKSYETGRRTDYDAVQRSLSTA